jgi:hypothetical protein
MEMKKWREQFLNSYLRNINEGVAYKGIINYTSAADLRNA